MSDPTNPPPFPLAMPPPGGPVSAIGTSLIAEAIAQSRRSPRRRIICPFHTTGGDPLQRMLNAIQPHSYVQPHRHSQPPKAESIIVLRGAIGYVTFDEHGAPDRVLVAGAGRDIIGVDTQPGVFHTFFALEEDTVLFEVKPGPYEQSADKDFAPWAPQEGTAAAPAYLEQLHRLCGEKTGALPPPLP